MSANTRKHSRRQFQTPSSDYNTNNNSKWNNDRNGTVDGSKPSTAAAITTKNLARPSMRSRLPPPTPTRVTGPVSDNLILAGYLAQEFITKGTLFGEAWDPDRSEESSRRGEKRKLSEGGGDGKEEIEKQQRYIEVAEILKGEANHLPGIFNPTQLARFLHMG